MKPLPIRLWLTVLYTAVTCLTYLCATLALYFGLRASIERNADRELAMRLEGIRVFLQQPDMTPDDVARELQEHGSVRLNGDPFQVVDQHRQWVYRPASVSPLNLAPEDPLPQTGRSSVSVIQAADRKLRIMSATVDASGRLYGIQIVSNLTAMYNLLGRFLWLSLGGIPVIIVAAGLGGYILSSRAMQPVLDITQMARKIGERNLSDRLLVSPAHDELRTLSLTLNEMLARLEMAFKRITQFTADASHELRTPIAVIRTTAEVTLERERSVPEYQQLVGQILVEAESTSTMIEDLLTLARSDAEHSMCAFGIVDLCQVGEEVRQNLMPVAHRKRIELEIARLDTAAPVAGLQLELKKLAVILVDNAIKYTSEGGRVEIRIAHFNNQLVFEVNDTGIGISEEDLPHVFERFYRADKGRSRENGGLGLGLSIAQAIAHTHHAYIIARSKEGVGSSFRVLFPPLIGTGYASETLHAFPLPEAPFTVS